MNLAYLIGFCLVLGPSFQSSASSKGAKRETSTASSQPNTQGGIPIPNPPQSYFQDQAASIPEAIINNCHFGTIGKLDLQDLIRRIYTVKWIVNQSFTFDTGSGGSRIWAVYNRDQGAVTVNAMDLFFAQQSPSRAAQMPLMALHESLRYLGLSAPDDDYEMSIGLNSVATTCQPGAVQGFMVDLAMGGGSTQTGGGGNDVAVLIKNWLLLLGNSRGTAAWNAAVAGLPALGRLSADQYTAMILRAHIESSLFIAPNQPIQVTRKGGVITYTVPEAPFFNNEVPGESLVVSQLLILLLKNQN